MAAACAEPLPAETRAAGRGDRADRGRGCAQRGRPAAVRPLRDGRLRGARRRTPTRRARWSWRASWPRARWPRRSWRRGLRSGSRRAPRCPRAPTRCCASRTRGVEGGAVTPAGPLAAGMHVRYRGEDVARGAVLAPAGTALGVASRDGARLGGRRRGRGAPPPGRARARHRDRAARAGRAARARPDPRVQPADAARAGRAGGRRGRRAPGRAGRRRPRPPRRSRPALGRRRARRLGRRLGRPARPRQAGAAGSAASRRSSGACGSSPASRCWFGRRGATLVFGLPGNPLSTVACFLLFVGPALRRLQGEAGAAPAVRPGPAGRRRRDPRTAARRSSPPRLARGSDGVLEATPTEGQGSHLTGALAASDGFVGRPARRRRAAGGRARRRAAALTGANRRRVATIVGMRREIAPGRYLRAASASAAWATGPQLSPLPSSTRFQTRTQHLRLVVVDEVVEDALDDLEVGRVARARPRPGPPR